MAELGSLPRATNAETKNLLLVLSDTQTFLSSSATSWQAKTAFCYIANSVVHLYTQGLPDTPTENREAGTHENIVARTAEYADELILLKPFVTDCYGQMMSELLKVPAHKHEGMNDKARRSIRVIQHMALTDLIGTLAAANEPSLPLGYRLTTLQSMVRNAPLLARTVPREERVRIAAMINEVVEQAKTPVMKKLIRIRQPYLSITGCEPACQAMR